MRAAPFPFDVAQGQDRLLLRKYGPYAMGTASDLVAAYPEGCAPVVPAFAQNTRHSERSTGSLMGDAAGIERMRALGRGGNAAEKR